MTVPSPAAPCLVAIGNFDGVHLGHQALLRNAAQLAAARGLTLVALTFEPHPRAFLTPDVAPARLTSPHLKRALLAQMGATPITLDFNAKLAAMTAEAFITDILQTQLNARHVVVGEDFTFGHRRQGNIALLQNHMGEAHITSLPLLADDKGVPYTSSHIRSLLIEGDWQAANTLLGRPYVIEMGISDILWPPEGEYEAYYSNSGRNWHDFTLNLDKNGPIGPLVAQKFIAFSQSAPQISLNLPLYAD